MGQVKTVPDSTVGAGAGLAATGIRRRSLNRRCDQHPAERVRGGRGRLCLAGQAIEPMLMVPLTEGRTRERRRMPALAIVMAGMDGKRALLGSEPQRAL